MDVSNNQNTVINDNQRIVDRLDFQLLITVIFFFVSAWAYLNNVICSFTDSEPITVQMSYILVHYIVTLFLIYSIILAAYKSFFLKSNQQVVKDYVYFLFNFYLDTWSWVLLICFFIIIFAGLFKYDWLLWSVFLIAFLAIKVTDNYPRKEIENRLTIFIGKACVAFLILMFGFMFFLSFMTSITNNVTIETDKNIYSLSDKVLVTVNARGYACKHKLVGLSEEYKDSKYYVKKGLIILNAAQIKNNEIGIATVSPTTGIKNFWNYLFVKASGKEPSYYEIDPNDVITIREKAHLTPKTINVVF